jgi:hypothetical protein
MTDPQPPIDATPGDDRDVIDPEQDVIDPDEFDPADEGAE